ncbi:MAG TPA: hypothetical protein VMV79_05500 [Alphaproteobacteria bacterium]|nr:hypothetical protein [Alphaproteobacteria bacterium]
MSGSVITALIFFALGVWGKFFLGRPRFIVLMAGGGILLAWEAVEYIRKKYKARRAAKEPPDSPAP